MRELPSACRLLDLEFGPRLRQFLPTQKCVSRSTSKTLPDMPSIDTRPFLNPSSEVATAEPWMLDVSGLPELLPQELKEWDPGQDIVLKRLLNVDVTRLCKGAGLSADAEVSLSVSWRSPGSQSSLAVYPDRVDQPRE